jgi:transcription termination/antitermination protein NusG
MFMSDERPDFTPSSEPSNEVSPEAKYWYAVQVASGCEKKVKQNLEQRLQTLDVADRLTGEEKVFPGYVLVRMILDDETWQVVKNTPNVINFVGAEQKRRYGRGRGHVNPVPLGASEVERIFRVTKEQEPVVKIDMATGDKIKVLSGPFKDFDGEVIEVSPERSKLKALLSIFGRDTPVELEFTQVRKEN